MTWTIDKQAKTCASCSKPFEGGAEVVSFLEQTPAGLVRFDRCPQCRPASSESVFSFWQHTVPKGIEKPPDTSRRLLQFFDNLVASGAALDGMKERTAFLLALALMRKRLLKHVSSSTREGKEMWTLRRAADGSQIELAAPRVAPEELDKLRDELAQMVDFEI